MNAQPLTTTLIDLASVIARSEFKLILGGGFGLYLKQLNRQQSNVRTLIPGELWPFPRATEDLDPNKDLGRHHALDVYRIVAMLTPEEYDAVRENVKRHSSSAAVQRSHQIIAEHFFSPTALGTLRLREHPLFTTSMDTATMISTLAELFP